ncbi:MAG: hypothetical protein KGN36_17105 [Acidobacteriota bacterium]|nr:hypothetical protein [Acidobacteriota bacterium]
MLPGDLLNDLSPHARVATAVFPFAVAMVLRLLFGKSRTASWLIMLTTVWFAVSVLMAPYSSGMRSDIRDLSRYWH